MTSDNKYVVYVDDATRVPNIYAAVFIKETPKSVLIKSTHDLEAFSHRSILNKERDNYAIVDRSTAKKAIYFARRYSNMYSQTMKSLKTTYRDNIFDLMKIIKE